MAAQRPPQSLGVRDRCELARPPTRGHGSWQLQRCAGDAAKAGSSPESRPPASSVARSAQEKNKFASDAPPIVNVFPGEQQEILFENALNIRFAEAASDGSTMFVKHHARGLIQVLPASLPRHVAEVGVFQIERREQFVEAPQLQKLSPVKSAGAASSIGARIQVADCPALCDGEREGCRAPTRIP